MASFRDWQVIRLEAGRAPDHHMGDPIMLTKTEAASLLQLFTKHAMVAEAMQSSVLHAADLRREKRLRRAFERRLDQLTERG